MDSGLSFILKVVFEKMKTIFLFRYNYLVNLKVFFRGFIFDSYKIIIDYNIFIKSLVNKISSISFSCIV